MKLPEQGGSHIFCHDNTNTILSIAWGVLTMTEFLLDFVLLALEKRRFTTQLTVPLSYSIQLTFKLTDLGKCTSRSFWCWKSAKWKDGFIFVCKEGEGIVTTSWKTLYFIHLMASIDLSCKACCIFRDSTHYAETPGEIICSTKDNRRKLKKSCASKSPSHEFPTSTNTSY